MKTLITIISILFFINISFCQPPKVKEYNDRYSKGLNKSDSGDYYTALQYFRKAENVLWEMLAEYPEEKKDSIQKNFLPFGTVNQRMMDCFIGLSLDDSVRYYFNRIVEMGIFKKRRLLYKCEYYKYLVNDARYNAWYEKLKDAFIENSRKINDTIIRQVYDIFFYDQYFRVLTDCNYFDSLELDSLKKLWIKTDSLNQLKIIQIIETHGYPGKSMVGSNLKDAGFFVIQHAPLEIQKKYFNLLYEAAAKQEFQPDLMKMLIDRILVREDKKQLFGTQSRKNDEGEYEKAPVETDPEKIKQLLEETFGISELAF